MATSTRDQCLPPEPDPQHLLEASHYLLERLDDIGFVDLELDAYVVERFREALSLAKKLRQPSRAEQT